MLSFYEARGAILSHVSTIGVEQVSLADAGGRVLATAVIAPWDIPTFDNSAMDGFALRSADCGNNNGLSVVDAVQAGGVPALPLQPGCAVRIMTGAPIPAGCDAVVPLEEAVCSGDKVLPRLKVVPRQHIRWRGEDFTANSEALSVGTILRPAEISLLAACNQAKVGVYRRPLVAVVSTGDELVELGQAPTAGKIVNSNALALAAAIRGIGAEPLLLGIARDNRESHLQLLSEGLKADILITSAGVSAGDCDLVREVLAELGADQIFWKIAVKPGGPTAFSMFAGKPVFSLPGNPVSVLLTFDAFVRPALLKMMGHQRVIKPFEKALLAEETGKKPGKLNMLRMKLSRRMDGRLQVSSAGNQQTGFLNTMLAADAIAFLPAEQEYFAAGEEVDIQIIREELFYHEEDIHSH